MMLSRTSRLYNSEKWPPSSFYVPNLSAPVLDYKIEGNLSRVFMITMNDSVDQISLSDQVKNL